MTAGRRRDQAGHDLREQGVVQVKDEEISKPSEATGTAALRAGWSHGHRDVSGGWLRPTVFGAVDGLVTNASLIAGLGGGGVSAHTVVLTGVAALVAGAFSMGTGEYVSVTNQNELVHAEVNLERKMLAKFPAAEQEELAGYFRDYVADPGGPGFTAGVFPRRLGPAAALPGRPARAHRDPGDHRGGPGHRRDDSRQADRQAPAALGSAPACSRRACHRS